MSNDDRDALAAFFDQREAAPQPDKPTGAGGVTYEVVGKHRVHGKRRGQTIDLDPEAPQTRFLVEVGHIRPVAGADTQEDNDG